MTNKDIITNKDILNEDFEELERVGKQKFNSYIDPKLISYDLSVLDKDLTKKEIREIDKAIHSANPKIAMTHVVEAKSDTKIIIEDNDV